MENLNSLYIIHKDSNVVEIKVKKDLFSKKAVIAASYILMEKSYVMFDDEEKFYLIFLKPKENYDLERLAWEFYTKLVEQEALFAHQQQTESIREKIIEQALSNYVEPEEVKMEEEAAAQQEEIKEEVNKAMYSFRIGEERPIEELFVEDPLGIAKPWEEKYGKSNSK